MRVLFVPLAAASHYFPVVPMSWAFRVAGHEVRVAAQPPIVDLIERSGQLAVPVGESYDLLAGLGKAEDDFLAATGRRLANFKDFTSMPQEPLQRYVATRRTAHIDAAAAMVDDLVEFSEVWRPDLVVTDLVTLAGPLIAEIVGAALVLHSWGPHFPSTTLPGYQPGAWPEELVDLYARHHAPTRPDQSLCVVDPCPPSLQGMNVANQLVTRYVPYNGSGVTPAWLRTPARRPRVGVSWSVSNDGMRGSERHPVLDIVAAIAELDVEVVLTVNATDRAAMDELGPDVRVVEALPLQMVAPTCAVAVNHGGAGTILTAATCGVPQVMLPQQQTSIFNADRVVAAGAGLSFQADAAEPATIAGAVAALLTDDSYAKAAQAIREENAAQRPAGDIVRYIEERVTVS
jgi:UDP:flavonoid glycosyltransferase YjiC (YdhE family)